MYTKNTKIVCTLGPSSDSVSEIENLVSAGMNVARLNFSHGTYEHHKKILGNLRKVERKMKRTVAVLQDLQGPKIRIGEMPEEGVKIKKSQTVELTIRNVVGTNEILPIQYKDIIKDLKKNDILFIDDGLLQLKVIKKGKDNLMCKVQVGGLVKTHKGVNCPTASISANPITAKDKKDLAWGLEHDVDYVALSFVKSGKDIEDLRKMIQKAGKQTKIVAKIERHEAVENLVEIVKAADGIMVARGDLGIEIPAEKVPIVQKRLINLCRKYGKPVITATQVLQSMVENARATRAEISDAANAVFDHTDAIMLSNESAVGKYPFKAARTLTKVAITVETELQKHEELIAELEKPKIISALNATCQNACELAKVTDSAFIIVYSEDGYTARHMAKHRLYTPIITITPSKKTARELALVWGINEVLVKKFPQKESGQTEPILDFLRKAKAIKKGQKVIIVCNASKKESLISTTKA